MYLKDIANILIKITGLIIIICAVRDSSLLVRYFMGSASHGVSHFFLSVLLPTMLPITLGIMIFRYPQKVTDSMVRIKNEEAEETGHSQMSLLQFEQIALTMLGFFFLYSSVSNVAFQIIQFIQAMYGFPFSVAKPSGSMLFTPDFLTTIFEMLFSLWLIFSSGTIARFMKKYRAEQDD